MPDPEITEAATIDAASKILRYIQNQPWGSRVTSYADLKLCDDGFTVRFPGLTYCPYRLGTNHHSNSDKVYWVCHWSLQKFGPRCLSAQCNQQQHLVQLVYNLSEI